DEEAEGRETLAGRGAGEIGVGPGAPALRLPSGWRNAEDADSAEGRRWLRIRDRWVGSGGNREGVLWAPCPVGRRFRGHHTGHGTVRPFPLPISWGGGQGV